MAALDRSFNLPLVALAPRARSRIDDAASRIIGSWLAPMPAWPPSYSAMRAAGSARALWRTSLSASVPGESLPNNLAHERIILAQKRAVRTDYVDERLLLSRNFGLSLIREERRPRKFQVESPERGSSR